MDELVVTSKIVLADTFNLYFKAHAFHWNVVGSDFVQLHGFFGDLYEDLHGAVDTIAEEIRALDEFVPMSLDEIVKLSEIKQTTDKNMSALLMINTLVSDNDKVIASLNKLFATATAQNKQGLADFAAGRLDVHNKHRWMLTAITK